MALEQNVEEQQQELQALDSIFGEDVTVLDESPIRLELTVPLVLEGARKLLVGRRVNTDAALGSMPLMGSMQAGSGGGSSSSSSTHAMHAVQNCGGTGVAENLPKDSSCNTAFVPAAWRYAEVLLEMRNGDAEENDGSVIVDHLPPLRLLVVFTEGYPSLCPPSFQLRSQWLSAAQLAALCKELDTVAEGFAGEPVVFAWADWLQSMALSCLGLDSCSIPLLLEASPAGYDTRAKSELNDPWDVLHTLQVFNKQHGWWTWQQTAHTCPICFSEKPGTAFVKMGTCAHTFCTECVSEMMRVHISEGTVASIRCPLPDCRRDVAPQVVHELADEMLYQRWHRLQVQRILTELPALVYCPRCEVNGVETPILPEEAEGSEDKQDLAVCDRPGCNFAFCPACRQPYHPASNCTAMMERLERLGLQQAAATKSNKQRLKDELESLRLIMSGTVPCPGCKMPITRTQGCNHMICSNCSTHFCYRCGADITSEGYNHFFAASCPTFDREEVERLQGTAEGGEDALEAELEELRRQFPDQAGMVWNFRPPPGAWRRAARKRQKADVPCPTCRQWNERAGLNNHVRCRICKTNFCYACKKLIRGTVTAHFRGQGACPQHASE